MERNALPPQFQCLRVDAGDESRHAREREPPHERGPVSRGAKIERGIEGSLAADLILHVPARHLPGVPNRQS